MASIGIINKTKTINMIITDRNDQHNEIQLYEQNVLTRVYKCRLEGLSISLLYEKLQDVIENKIPFEIGYPNFLFHGEKNDDKIAVSFTVYPSEYYKIDLDLGYSSDLTCLITQ